MSRNINAEPNRAEQAGRTIARANARLITAKEASEVSGAQTGTSCTCYWYKGVCYEKAGGDE